MLTVQWALEDSMRIDWYTKGVLTVVAILLGVIALRPYVSPDAVAHAQASFAGVVPMGNKDFFDARTGDIWMYDYVGGGEKARHYRLNKLGAPEIEVK
jgi:hypothetical protein